MENCVKISDDSISSKLPIFMVEKSKLKGLSETDEFKSIKTWFNPFIG